MSLTRVAPGALAAFISTFSISIAGLVACAADARADDAPPAAGTVATVTSSTATDDPVPQPYARPPAWGKRHPVAIGTRMNARLADGYNEGGLGGHLRIRPFKWVRLELFEDNFVGIKGPSIRHDHEVGSTLQFPLLDTGRFLLYPMIGACAMLADLEPGGGSPAVTDIRFGLHGGVGAELAIGAGISMELEVEVVGYTGHQISAYEWTASVAPTLSYYAVGQATLGANYWF